MFIGALFGDMKVSFAPDDGPFFHACRNGRLHVTEPDGSVHGNHPYLSAVAVLRHAFPQDAWAAAMRQSQEAGSASPLGVLLRQVQQLLARQAATSAEAVCLDVFESVSASAVPLPREVFAGPRDTRWGSPGWAATGSSPGRAVDTAQLPVPDGPSPSFRLLPSVPLTPRTLFCSRS